MKHITAALLLILCTSNAAADWTLDAQQSQLNFISIKKNSIGESHSFQQLSGSIKNEQAVVYIALASVETGIEIRNTRMQNLLFKSAQNPLATFSYELPTTLLNDLARPVGQAIELKGELTLNGKTLPINATVRAVQSENSLRVTTLQPILLNAADFDLVPGIQALQEVAKLSAIATSIPVTFDVSFTQASEK